MEVRLKAQKNTFIRDGPVTTAFFFCLFLITLEQKPLSNSIDGSETQLWAELLVFGPVLLLTLFTAVVHIQAPAQDYRHNLTLITRVPGENSGGIGSYLAQRFRFCGFESWFGLFSHWAQILNDSSIFSNISFWDLKVMGLSLVCRPVLNESRMHKESEHFRFSVKKQKNRK